MTGYTCERIEIARLKPTEMVDAAHVRMLAEQMQRDGVQRRPVLVERHSLAILDGHHRYHAAKALGLAFVNAVVIDYSDPRLTLASWTERSFTPTDVREAAETGQLLPAKSTRHILNPPVPDMPRLLTDLKAAPTVAQTG